MEGDIDDAPSLYQDLNGSSAWFGDSTYYCSGGYGNPNTCSLALTRSQCTPQPRLFLLLAPPTDPPCVWSFELKKKEDLASFLSANNVNIVTENLMLPPSIQGSSWQSPWTPSLDTIAEPTTFLEIYKHLGEEIARYTKHFLVVWLKYDIVHRYSFILRNVYCNAEIEIH